MGGAPGGGGGGGIGLDEDKLKLAGIGVFVFLVSWFLGGNITIATRSSLATVVR